MHINRYLSTKTETLNMAKTTGGAIMAKMLKQEGVETIFAIIGGTYTAFYTNCVADGLTLVTPRHELLQGKPAR